MCEEDLLGQDRLRSSLWLCVRSVRHMTEQLVTIISSLGETDCKKLRGAPPPSSLSSLHCSPCFDQSRSSGFSSSCENCTCAKNYYRFASTPNKCHENLISDRCIPISAKKSIKTKKVETSSQTTGKLAEDKQSYTTPERATQTQNDLSGNTIDKSEHDQIRNSLLPLTEVGTSEMTILPNKAQSWDQLIRSQIEETIARKISEKLSQKFNEIENIKTTNSHYTEKLASMKSNKVNKLMERETSSQMKRDNIFETDNLKEKNRILSAGSINVFYNYDHNSLPDTIKRPISQSVVLNDQGYTDISQLMKDNHQRKKELKTISSNKDDKKRMNQETYSDYPSIRKISVSINRANIHGDPLLLNDVIKDIESSDEYLNVSNYKMEVDPMKEENTNFKNDSMSSETFSSNMMKRNIGNHNSVSKDSLQPRIKLETDVFDFDRNLEEFSIFDEYDYVSEVELLSLSNSKQDAVEVFGFSSDISVYNSEFIQEDKFGILQFKKGENFKLNAKNTKRSDNTIVSSKMSNKSSNFSAFSEIISKSKNSSPFTELSSLLNNMDDYEKISEKSNPSLILSLSDKMKYINNIKSINTLSSSNRERNIQYKSISVTNLDRNFSNKSPGSTFSGISFYPSSSLDISSSVKDVFPKDFVNCPIKSSYTHFKNIEESFPDSKTIWQNEINKRNKLENTFNKSYITQNKLIYFKQNKKHDTSFENNNENQHNSDGFILLDEYFIEPFEERDSSNLTEENVEDINIVNVSYPSKMSPNSQSMLSDDVQSLYCNVQNDDENISSNENIRNQDDPESQNETIFLQATLEVDNGNSKKADSKLYKIRFDKNYFSIEDDETIFNKSLPDSRELDTMVSCFDKVYNIKEKMGNNVKDKKLRFHHSKNKIKIKGFSEKKKNRKNTISCSLVECYLDDWENFDSREQSIDRGSVIKVDEVDFCER